MAIASRRSRWLRHLYPERTDCVYQWLAGVLGNREHPLYVKQQSFMARDLAFAPDSFAFFDNYHRKSLRLIRWLQTQAHQQNFLQDFFLSSLEDLENYAQLEQAQVWQNRILKHLDALASQALGRVASRVS